MQNETVRNPHFLVPCRLVQSLEPIRMCGANELAIIERGGNGVGQGIKFDGMINHPLGGCFLNVFQRQQGIQPRPETDFEEMDFLLRDRLQSGADKDMFRFLARAVHRVVMFVHLRQEERMAAICRQLQFAMDRILCFHARKGTKIPVSCNNDKPQNGNGKESGVLERYRTGTKKNPGFWSVTERE